MLVESGTTHGRFGFPPTHPHYAGGLPLWSPDIRRRLSDFDVLLVCGMDLMRQYVYHEGARAIPEHVRLVQLDEDPYQLGKNYPLAVALLGDTKPGLAELGELQLLPQRVWRAAQRIGAERVEECRAAARYAELALPAQRESPVAQVPRVARVQMDGGRFQEREQSAADPSAADGRAGQHRVRCRIPRRGALV